MDKQAVHTWIQERYHQNPKVQEMARWFGYSICYFHREFKAAFGVSPKQYMLNLRLDEAHRLIEQHGYSSNLLWINLGFCANSKFSKQYKRRFGMTPAQHRKRVWGMKERRIRIA